MRNLTQIITHWRVTHSSTGWGYNTPVSLKGRWEQDAREFINAQGERHVSKDVVALSDDVAVGDYIFNGESEAAIPPDGSERVAHFTKIPNLRNLDYERVAYTGTG